VRRRVARSRRAAWRAHCLRRALPQLPRRHLLPPVEMVLALPPRMLALLALLPQAMLMLVLEWRSLLWQAMPSHFQRARLRQVAPRGRCRIHRNLQVPVPGAAERIRRRWQGVRHQRPGPQLPSSTLSAIRATQAEKALAGPIQLPLARRLRASGVSRAHGSAGSRISRAHAQNIDAMRAHNTERAACPRIALSAVCTTESILTLRELSPSRRPHASARYHTGALHQVIVHREHPTFAGSIGVERRGEPRGEDRKAGSDDARGHAVEQCAQHAARARHAQLQHFHRLDARRPGTLCRHDTGRRHGRQVVRSLAGRRVRQARLAQIRGKSNPLLDSQEPDFGFLRPVRDRSRTQNRSGWTGRA
jgi:hypothetical protein